MSFLARLLPFQYYIAAATLAVTLGGLGVQTLRLHHSQTHAIRIQAEWDGEKARALAAAVKQSEANRAEETRRTAAITGIVNDTIVKASAVAADASAANAARERLSVRIAALVAGAREAARHPGTAGTSPPAGDPIGVLAFVLGRADERAGVLADYADRARIAGLACEASYDSLGK